MTIIHLGSYSKLKSLTVRVNPFGFTVIDLTPATTLAIHNATVNSKGETPHWLFTGPTCAVLPTDDFVKIIENNWFTEKTVYTMPAARAMSNSFMFIPVGERYIYVYKQRFVAEVKALSSSSEPFKGTGAPSWRGTTDEIERVEDATEAIKQRYIENATSNKNFTVDFISVPSEVTVP